MRWKPPRSRRKPVPAQSGRSSSKVSSRDPSPISPAFIAGAALARFAASRGDKAARRAIRARDGVAKGVERRRCGRVDFRADVRAGNRVDLVAENPPGGQPLDIMPIERNETGAGDLRRGAQLAGAERGGRAP